MKVYLFLLLAGAARAQAIRASGPTPASFIPSGYQLLYEGRGRATGDLNGDGRPDVALALTSIAEHTTRQPGSSYWPPRLLLILWRTASGYRLAAQSRWALLHRSDSYLGDPFDAIVIKRGLLLVQYDVGGNNGRSTTAKFRYQGGGFYLIGETNAYGTHRPDCGQFAYPPGYTYRDTNFLTGKYKAIKVSEDCELLENKHGRQPVQSLRKLVDYKPVAYR